MFRTYLQLRQDPFKTKLPFHHPSDHRCTYMLYHPLFKGCVDTEHEERTKNSERVVARFAKIFFNYFLHFFLALFFFFGFFRSFFVFFLFIYLFFIFFFFLIKKFCLESFVIFFRFEHNFGTCVHRSSWKSNGCYWS